MIAIAQYSPCPGGYKISMRTLSSLVLSVISLLIIGCAQTSTITPIVAQSLENKLSNYVYVDPSAVPDLQADTTRILMYRPQRFLGMMANVNVLFHADSPGNASHRTSKNLLPGSFFIVDKQSHNLGIVLMQKGWESPVDEHKLELQKGMVYIFRLGMKPTHTYLESVDLEKVEADFKKGMRYSGYLTIEG